MNFHKSLVCSAAALLIGTSALAQETPAVEATADTVLATVNGEEITLGQLIVLAARLPQQYQSLPDDVLFEGLLDQVIQQTAITAANEATLSRGSEIALENERRSLLAGEALARITESAVTDEAVQALYDERFANAEPAQEYNAAHILVETEEEAAAIKAEIDGGADFTTVAKERSTGPSGPNGGELGWFEKGMMVEPFETVVIAMEPGQVSDPVQTQFGWHVIRLNEVRAKEAPSLDEVRDELVAELQTKAVDAAVEEAMGKVKVVKSTDGIAPAALRDLTLVD